MVSLRDIINTVNTLHIHMLRPKAGKGRASTMQLYPHISFSPLLVSHLVSLPLNPLS
jgi:hypothetical protein